MLSESRGNIPETERWSEVFSSKTDVVMETGCCVKQDSSAVDIKGSDIGPETSYRCRVLNAQKLESWQTIAPHPKDNNRTNLDWWMQWMNALFSAEQEIVGSRSLKS